MDSLDWFSTDNFIQEIDGVKVNYVNENNGAKTISFKQISKQNVKPISIDFNESFINVDDFVDVDVPAKASKSTPKIIEKIIPIIEEQKMVELDQNGPDISKWEEFRLSPFLLKGLQDLGFTYPTDIQKRSLPFTLSGKRDILGAASTGSGKTLAFGLPILQSLISTHSSKMGFHSLILVPTRELALQVSDHLKKVSAHFKCRVSFKSYLDYHNYRRSFSTKASSSN